MNIYFIKGTYIRQDRQKVLLDSLKVKEVMLCFDSREDRPQIDDSVKDLISVESVYNTDEKYRNAYSKIVFRFVNTVCTPFFDHGEMVDVAIDDLFKDSSYYRPYFNQKNSTDPNLLIMHNNDSVPTDVSRYILNILNKRTGDTRFQERIAFVQLSEYLRPVHFPKINVHYDSLYYKKNFTCAYCPSLHSKTDEYKTYDAIETIVKQNSLESRYIEPGRYYTIHAFFINDEGHERYDDLSKWEEEEWEEQRKWNEIMWNAEDQARENERENFWWTHGYYPPSSDDDY